ncbi:hypothetical protein G4B88_006815 [Cannabis sativa]|uniref:Uncharacterized protein n=1 Tax=Cannabis sativa TaxID=3483 RepID=A0A7J6GWR4_CANSA|nr:hypothetical protein G4B88_006815 [Cannabis sativa]
MKLTPYPILVFIHSKLPKWATVISRQEGSEVRKHGLIPFFTVHCCLGFPRESPTVTCSRYLVLQANTSGYNQQKFQAFYAETPSISFPALLCKYLDNGSFHNLYNSFRIGREQNTFPLCSGEMLRKKTLVLVASTFVSTQRDQVSMAICNSNSPSSSICFQTETEKAEDNPKSKKRRREQYSHSVFASMIPPVTGVEYHDICSFPLSGVRKFIKSQRTFSTSFVHFSIH